MKTTAEAIIQGTEKSRISKIEDDRRMSEIRLHESFACFVSVQIHTNAKPTIEVDDFLTWVKQQLQSEWETSADAIVREIEKS